MARLKRARAGRRVWFVLLCAVLVAGALNVFGVRTAEVQASGGGYELSVRYPKVTRSGLAINFSAEVRREGGFPGAVTVAARSSYFDILDQNGFEPEPIGTTTDAERVIWTFEAPKDSDVLVIALDARVEPSVQLRSASGSIEVLEDGRAVASAAFETFVMP